MDERKVPPSYQEEAKDSPSANTRSKVVTNTDKNMPFSPKLPGCTPKKGKPNHRTNRTPVSSGPDPGGSGKSDRTKISEIRAAALKKKREENAMNALAAEQAIYDPDATAREAKNIIRGETGLIMDEFMERHFNPWDKDHIERPERLTYIRKRINQLGLADRCKQVCRIKNGQDYMGGQIIYEINNIYPCLC